MINKFSCSFNEIEMSLQIDEGIKNEIIERVTSSHVKGLSIVSSVERGQTILNYDYITKKRKASFRIALSNEEMTYLQKFSSFSEVEDAAYILRNKVMGVLSLIFVKMKLMRCVGLCKFDAKKYIYIDNRGVFNDVGSVEIQFSQSVQLMYLFRELEWMEDDADNVMFKDDATIEGRYLVRRKNPSWTGGFEDVPSLGFDSVKELDEAIGKYKSVSCYQDLREDFLELYWSILKFIPGWDEIN